MTKSRKTRHVLTFGDFWTTECLFDDNVTTWDCVSTSTGAQDRIHTFWTERYADGISEHVDTLENTSSTLIRELNLLVSTARELWSLGGCTAKRF